MSTKPAMIVAQIEPVRLDLIDVSDRLRAVDPAEVARLALSFVDVGQMQPIEVAKSPSSPGFYTLVSGGHRTAAARLLDWTEIQAIVVAGKPDELRLRKIDENLYRRELSPYDQAAFLAERRDVCQRLGLISADGGRGGRSAKLALRTYQEEIADKFGLSRRDLFRSLRRRTAITAEVWARIRGTELAEKGVFLDALAGVPGEKQMAVVQAYLTSPEAGSKRPPFAALCREAVGAKPGKPAVKLSRLKALTEAWKRADHVVIEAFVGGLRPAERVFLTRLLSGDK